MLIGGRGAGSMSAEQANRWTACCSASSGEIWGGGPAGSEALGGGLKKKQISKKQDTQNITFATSITLKLIATTINTTINSYSLLLKHTGE